MVRRIASRLSVLLFCAVAAAQSVTPNLQLTQPKYGSSGWGTAINNDLGLIDSAVGLTQLPYQGNWSSATVYNRGAQVAYNGSVYASKLNGNINNLPTNGSAWLLLPSGSPTPLQASVPTTGTWQQGNFVLNSGALANHIAGWINVAAGTPGSWAGVPLGDQNGNLAAAQINWSLLAGCNTIGYVFSPQSMTCIVGGGGGSGDVWQTDDLSSGANGSNTVFNLSQTPNPASSLQLGWNGQVLASTYDYTISGKTITLINGVLPQTGDSLIAYYRVTTVSNFANFEVPGGLVNGTNAVFTLAHTPTGSLQILRNGIAQAQNVDFTISGSTITFGSQSIPQSGDLLFANYAY